MSWVCGRFWGYNNEFVAPVFMGLKLERDRERAGEGGREGVGERDDVSTLISIVVSSDFLLFLFGEEDFWLCFTKAKAFSIFFHFL